MWAVLRFWMNSYVPASGWRTRFWDWKLPESWSGPKRCVAPAMPGDPIPASTQRAPAASRVPHRMVLPDPLLGDREHGRPRTGKPGGLVDHGHPRHWLAEGGDQNAVGCLRVDIT